MDAPDGLALEAPLLRLLVLLVQVLAGEGRGGGRDAGGSLLHRRGEHYLVAQPALFGRLSLHHRNRILSLKFLKYSL